MSSWPEAGAPAEAQRSRLLRRADGRFLLPGPRLDRSVCFAADPLAEAVAAISGETLPPGPDLRGACDLAVAADPDTATLRAAWSALRPGGVYYGEYYSPPLAGGAARLRQVLEAAGFTQVTVYWAWPLPDRGAPLFWLPVEAPHALRYFLATRPRAASAWLRARNRLLQPAWRLGLRAGLLAPLCVVAQRPPAPEAAGAANLLETIRASWSAWGLGPTPAKVSWLLLTGGRSRLNKVAGLVFADNIDQPGLIVKLPRMPASAAALAHEADILRAVHASRPGGVAGVPQVIFLSGQDETLALGESVLGGQPLFTRLERRTFRQWALTATDWLAGLAGRGYAQPRADGWARLIEPALADFERNFGDVVPAADLAETRARLVRLPDLPRVIEQRDFSPWNVLVDGAGALAVLDWESAEPDGLPALDLIYFLSYLAFFLEGAMETRRFAETYRATLDPASFIGGVIAECQQRYAAQVGIPPAALHPLRLLTWLIHSRSEYRQLAAEHGGPPERAARRDSVFVSLWAAELGQAHRAPAPQLAQEAA